MDSENPQVAEIRRGIADSYNRLNQLVTVDLAGLSPDRLYTAPTENEWSLMQNLAHIIEFMPYWGNEIAGLVETPGRNFGRLLTDETRLGAIVEHGLDNLETVRAALPVSYNRLQAALDGLDDADLTKTGVHIKFGEQRLEWFIGEFIADHLKNHLTQMRECLAVIA
ncbi:MAG: hypothetical protein JWP00_2867 [Chloroflexi bacterium]|jgi:uncharacterized damage-inducible protein DinB|nr:hypothetical protein [Chloroflexota bacterium]